MAQDLITSFSDFNPTDTTYGAPRTNKNGGKNVNILNAEGKTLVLCTPLIMTWGVNRMEDDDTGRVSYNLSLQFPDEQRANPSTNQFYEKMCEFQEKVLSDAVNYKKEWFNKSKMSREVAEALFYPMLRHPNDKMTGEPDLDRAPTFRLKIPYWEGEFGPDLELYNWPDKTTLFNRQTDLGSSTFESLIPKTSYMKAVIQCNGVWFAAGKFGVTWKLIQAVVRRPVRIQGSCFIDVTDDDLQQVSSLSKYEAEASASAEVVDELTATTTDVQDSEEEEETSVVATPVKKVKRKRRVIKKKTEVDVE